VSYFEEQVYGLVPNTRVFYMKLVTALKGCGFKEVLWICLWIKYSDYEIAMATIYVDNS
jgi:hypothetical protein